MKAGQSGSTTVLRSYNSIFDCSILFGFDVLL